MTTNTTSKIPSKSEVSANLKSEYPEVRDIRDDLGSIKKNLAGLAQHALEAGTDNISALRDRAGKQWDRALVASKDSMKVVENRVRERPGQSLIAAFAAGLVLSFLFGRK